MSLKITEPLLKLILSKTEISN